MADRFPVRTPLLIATALVLLAARPGLADAAADDALIHAVYAGDMRAMQDALRAGASFNARDENGYTPLHWAAFRGYVVLARYMLDRGATTDVPDYDGYTPLMLAAWNGHDTVVRLLLARGAKRERTSKDGYTPYDYARSQGHLSLLPLLATTRPTIPWVQAPAYVRRATPRPVAWTPAPAFTDGPRRATPTPWSPEAAPTPTPEPSEPLQEPTPAAIPTPRPAAQLLLGAGGPPNEVEVVTGMHLSRLSFPIAGVHYRRTLLDWCSARVGVEYGRTQVASTGALELGYTRLHAALLTNGWLYVGAGATQVTLGTLYAGGYTPGVTSWEGIAGLRLGTGPVAVNGEFRFGYNGPSTALGGLGVRF